MKAPTLALALAALFVAAAQPAHALRLGGGRAGFGRAAFARVTPAQAPSTAPGFGGGRLMSEPRAHRSGVYSLYLDPGRR